MNRTIGPRETLGVAIVVLGLFAIFAPAASSRVATEFGGDTLAVLTGTVWGTGLMVTLAGLAVLFGRQESEG